jgi:hypothetical protein
MRMQRGIARALRRTYYRNVMRKGRGRGTAAVFDWWQRERYLTLFGKPRPPFPK